MVLHCWVYGWVSFGGMWGCRPWWGLWDHSQEGTVPSTGLRDCVGGSEITHRHATESADVPWINIGVTLLSLKSKIKKKLVYVIWPKCRSLSLVDITPLSCLHVNCWLSSSLPKPLCQAPYHATLCCLQLADGLSRQCTGVSLCSLSPCHPSGRRQWWHAGLFPCPPPPCSAARGSTTLTPSSPSPPLAEGRCDWEHLPGAPGLSPGMGMEFSFFLPWRCDSQLQWKFQGSGTGGCLVPAVGAGAHPNPLWILELISSVKKKRRKNIFVHSLILCHHVQVRNPAERRKYNCCPHGRSVFGFCKVVFSRMRKQWGGPGTKLIGFHLFTKECQQNPPSLNAVMAMDRHPHLLKKL